MRWVWTSASSSTGNSSRVLTPQSNHQRMIAIGPSHLQLKMNKSWWLIVQALRFKEDYQLSKVMPLLSTTKDLSNSQHYTRSLASSLQIRVFKTIIQIICHQSHAIIDTGQELTLVLKILKFPPITKLSRQLGRSPIALLSFLKHLQCKQTRSKDPQMDWTSTLKIKLLQSWSFKKKRSQIKTTTP